MSIKSQKALVKFVRKYPGWHSFSQDKQTVTDVCACSNLGILEVRGDQMILKSAEKADQWINSFEK